jgi:ADP-dependent phosphofructokinase/glucokinase
MEPVMTGFNVNLDRSIPVSQEVLDLLLRCHTELPGFLRRFWRSLRLCAADEFFVQDTGRFLKFCSRFSRSGTLSVGGQAGIAALHLRATGAPGVICLAPLVGDTAREVLGAAGVTVIGTPPREGMPDLIHLVFEHSPGLVLHDRNVVSRKSRFIVSGRHPAGSVLLPDPLLDEAERAVASVRRLFLSGYQYLTSDTEFVAAAGQIRRFREYNHDLVIHVEWVCADDPLLTGRLVSYILPEVDSLGVNEQELALLCRHLYPAEGPAGRVIPRPEGIMRQALDLCRRTGLQRVHVHTYGYYCVVRRDPEDPERTRDSLLFASREVVGKSELIAPHLVAEGKQALTCATGLFGPARLPGIFSAGEEFRIIVIPTLISESIARTAGLGDRISSAAFDTDLF